AGNSTGPAFPSIPSTTPSSSSMGTTSMKPAPSAATAAGPALAGFGADPPTPKLKTETGYEPSYEALQSAQKCAKFAVSALQFDDLPYAIQNLREALKLLTGEGK